MEKQQDRKIYRKTITEYDVFRKELKKIKLQGFAEDDGKNELGVRCIGAPVFNYHGEIEGAIIISGPATRVTKDKIDEIAIEVMKYAQFIPKELGYRG